MKKAIRGVIVGSGPAGFYTASQLLKTLPNLKIDILDKLPTPYGLVRYGVAPDHPEVKNVIHKFESVAKDDRVRFIGLTELTDKPINAYTKPISLAELQQSYNFIVLSYGCSLDRQLPLKNEEDYVGSNILSARAFVSWYNGHPESSLNINLEDVNDVTIIGMGNVALDLARILLTPVNLLAKTDISNRALTELRKSNVRNVNVVGRRGVLDIAFTSKELREMAALPITFKTDLPLIRSTILSETTKEILSKNRPKKRLLDSLLKYAIKSSSEPEKDKSWKLHFNSNAISVNHHTKGLKSVEFNNGLSIPSQLLLKSIGYRATVADKAIPFDKTLGVVPNVKGRVLQSYGNPVNIPGLYVSGWLKTGPVGVIASTMYDAYETAISISEDLSQLTAVDGKSGLEGAHFGFNEWKKLDEYEVLHGEKHDKPREKVTSIGEMMQIVSNKNN